MKLNQITISVSNEATFSVEFSENITPGKTVIYFECDELNKTVKELEAKGIKFFKQPANKPWLWREAYLRDPDWHIICSYYAGGNRLNPPWRIKN